MHILTFTFKILSLCGVWLPLHWQNVRALSLCYNLYSAAIIFATYVMVSLQFLLLATSDFSVELVTEILFTFLTAVSVCAKAMNFLARRGKVMYLANMLLKSWCVSRNEEEFDMERKTDSFIRLYTIFFNAAGQMTLFCLIVTPFLEDTDRPKLPFPIWTPYDLYEGYNYWITFSIQVLPLMFGVLLNVTTDVLVSGFVLQACRQFDILKHRLRELPNLVKHAMKRDLEDSETVRFYEEQILQQTVLHHDYIFSYTKVVMETFDLVIVEQFFASVLVFSVIVYQLSMGGATTIQKIMSVGYLSCMLTELFTYCWFGNEITLKSEEFADDIYEIDWTVLSKKANRTLLFVMLRTMRPIIMCYGNLIVLNIESFKSILKVTYSAFNVLKESADTT